MKHEETGLDDFLLPDSDTMQEFEIFSDEDFNDVAQSPLRGVFSDSPERASLWMEEASRHFIAA